MPIGHGEFGRAGGSRCSYIGDKISDREINLVPDSANDRNRAIDDSPGQFLLIERPQVFERATTAPDDQYVTLVATNRGVECGDQLGYCGVALDRRRVNNHRDRRKTATQDADNIANGGAGRGGDDTNAFGQGRQVLLAVLVKQAFGSQHLLEDFELALEGAFAGRLDLFEDQLVVATWFVKTDTPEGQHLVAVLETDGRPALTLTKEGRADLRRIVF